MTSVNNRPEILSKLGVGSGLDTSALIESLVEAGLLARRSNSNKENQIFCENLSIFTN